MSQPKLIFSGRDCYAHCCCHSFGALSFAFLSLLPALSVSFGREVEFPLLFGEAFQARVRVSLFQLSCRATMICVTFQIFDIHLRTSLSRFSIDFFSLRVEVWWYRHLSMWSPVLLLMESLNVNRVVFDAIWNETLNANLIVGRDFEIGKSCAF